LDIHGPSWLACYEFNEEFAVVVCFGNRMHPAECM